MLAPSSGGPLSESAAPPGIGEAPEAATGRCAYSLSLERLPMSIRNGTSSSSNPQTTNRRLRQAATERRRGGGGLWMDKQITSSAAGIDWAKDEHALCVT